ncbi:MAG: hypothetical protein J0H45_00570 [Stenotrophomonas nitritireducens]|uniref:Uncharacterized protein n=1 Tax=Stenotrophomonas nitritireducens TaxID=83617 RepID=A0A9D8PZI2_9GAMM|nr:hypothetical protein [Stenotrophomonas nitritireducens]
MNPAELLDGYRDRSCARQWRGFLQAMAAEFDQALPEEESARLMARIGQRFADAHGLAARFLQRGADGPVETLSQGFRRHLDAGNA